MAINDSQQRLLRTVLTGIPGLLALKNKQLAYEVVNPAFCQFLGRAPEAIIGKKDGDLFPEEEAKLCQQVEATIFKTGMPKVQEQPLTGVEGKRWIDITRAPVLDEDGDPAGILLFARDITEFKQREEELKTGLAKQQALEQRAAQASEQLQVAVQAAETAKAQAVEQEQKLAAFQSQLQENLKRLQEREAELLAVAKQAQMLQAQMAEREQQAQTDQAQLAQARQQAAADQAQLAQARQQAGALQEEIQRAQAALAEQQRQVEQMNEEVAEGRQRIQQAEARRKDAAALAQQLMNTLQS